MEQDCQHLAQQNARLAARLAEVEAANAKFIEKLNTHLTAEDRRSLAALLGYELGVEEGRAEGQAERDRLAQELEDALGHLRAVLDAWDAMAENYEMGPFFEAREFLARFPREGDEG